MKENIVKNKTYVFALRMIEAYKYLIQEQQWFVFFKQALRSGMSIEVLSKHQKINAIKKNNFQLLPFRKPNINFKHYCKVSTPNFLLPTLNSQLSILNS